MVKIDQIESVSRALTCSTIELERKRCSYMRNWRSKCRACLNVCPHKAIKRTAGHIDIDDELCTDCGACVAACHMGTFMPTSPTPGEIVREAGLSAQRCGGNPCFACAPLAKARGLDPARVCVLPCLNYLDEYLLVGLLAQGYKRVAIMREEGLCTGCKVGTGENCEEPYFPTALSHVDEMLAQWQFAGRVLVTDKIPAALCTKGRASAPAIGTSRRNAFDSATGTAFEYAATAIDDFIKGNPKKPKSPRVVVTNLDRFPRESYKSVRLLQALRRGGTVPADGELRYPFWGMASVDTSKCKACGICAKNCPTQALEFSENEDGTCNLDFLPELCMGCELCRNMCPARAMLFDNRVMMRDMDAPAGVVLYEDLEPKKKTRSSGSKKKDATARKSQPQVS